ncbi:hypothetical protein [Klebsiella pneumoniae]|uniref:hypothetical protein n=1 Tax=Klebsiella pneumoniae TaxID=573 RepID=UPI001ABC3552|nr:hypothetical protein [Klebsiella pneumoniae]MBO3720639.1 hypothetical protein [Klebsiella pneumoniae]HCM5827634.1 hypothetical protein [Klebsiella pneumoniae]
MSEFSRETLLNIIETDHVQCGDASALARMALAAMDSEPVAYISKSDFDAGYPHILARRDFNKACTMPVYAEQPAPVVPEEKPIPNTLSMYAVDAVAAIAEVKGWNACRAAMLQEFQKSAGAEEICRNKENVQVMHTKSPAQSDCCPAQNSVSPAQDGNSPATSDNWQVEAEKLAEMHGMSFVLFRHGEAPQCADPTKVVISFTDKGLGHDALPATPQEVR